MKIEHIAMYVTELEASRDFFVTCLGGKSNDGCLYEYTIAALTGAAIDLKLKATDDSA